MKDGKRRKKRKKNELKASEHKDRNKQRSDKSSLGGPQRHAPERLCEFLGANGLVTELQLVKDSLQSECHTLGRVITLCGHLVYRLSGWCGVVGRGGLW